MNTPHSDLRRTARIGPIAFAGAAFFAAALSSRAQTAPATAEAKPEEVVKLNVFEVRSTQDQGYISKETATGLKTGTDLMDLPVSVTIVPRQLIDDVGERAGRTRGDPAAHFQRAQPVLGNASVAAGRRRLGIGCGHHRSRGATESGRPPRMDQRGRGLSTPQHAKG